ncbi:hypothetical protein [Microbacterium saperdae]|uniref:Peptidase inhibitor family I36 n=1 Tax=Microbacterium saperdae TaxID=69368 RepID=A0A543BAL6_9MICO|nr:hypothetical protein [Microbacterium saperdae]TQL81891.1 hypothetical protein FB560_3372 [Microbacterium saperdae]GGM35547.1 hypothetical protein GCM10010489_03060 [Microbacterium saperdae]
MKKRLLSLALGTVLAMGIATPAQASEEPALHPDVQYAIDAVPGGTVVDEHTVVWPDLGMELSVPSPDARAVGSCATGSYCAYAGANRGGTKLSWTSCTTVSTAALSTVGSIANARSSGTVQARNAAGTVLGSAGAGASVNVSGGTTNLRCLP